MSGIFRKNNKFHGSQKPMSVYSYCFITSFIYKKSVKTLKGTGTLFLPANFKLSTALNSKFDRARIFEYFFNVIYVIKSIYLI